MTACCKPNQREEDRTHTVHYWQEYFDGDPGDPPVIEDHGVFDIACTHEDAVSLASMRASACDGIMRSSKTGVGPKYLNGLKGDVQELDVNRCAVRLDEESTMTLRFSGTRYSIPNEVKRYVLKGIPRQCCEVVG